MDKGKIEWIDPAAARRLLLEYRQTLGVKGGSEIERQIDTHTRLGISRKTIENWLNDPNSVPSAQTLKIVLRFLQTEHFQKVVPRSRDYLDADARLCRIAAALFDLYGAPGVELPVLTENLNRISGWWEARRVFEGNSSEPSYLYVVPVSDQPFSKLHLLLQSDDVPCGPGVLFPRMNGTDFEFTMRVWSRGVRFEEKPLMTAQFAATPDLPERLQITFEPRDQSTYPASVLINVSFYRVDEQQVPDGVRDMFDEWSRDILPRDLDRRSFVL